MTPTDARPAHSLDVELALAQARDDARHGDLDGARRRLGELGDTDPEVLDLRARVLAQSGDLDGAERDWRRLADAEPGHPAAAAGSRAVADVRSGRRRRRGVAAGVGAVLVAAVVAMVPVLLLTARPGSEAAIPDQPPRTTAAPAERGPSPTTTPPVDTGAVSLAAALDGPGIHTRADDGAVEVEFEQGLFVRSTELTPAGRRLLVALAPRLTERVERVEVVGHSVVVPGGPTTGGSTVALARAQRAAVILARSGPLPLTRYTVRAAERTRATGDAAAEARTVTLRLVVQGAG